MTQTLYLVGRRVPLRQYPPFYRWLARWLYQRMHWCPDFGIQYQGIRSSETDARLAADVPGGFYMELPLDSNLPIDACQFGRHDFPQSEASPYYRSRRMAYTAVPTDELERLHDVIERSTSTERVH